VTRLQGLSATLAPLRRRVPFPSVVRLPVRGGGSERECVVSKFCSFILIKSLVCPQAGVVAGGHGQGAVWIALFGREQALTVTATVAVNLALLAASLWCLYRGLRSARREARGLAMSIRRLGSMPMYGSIASLLCFIGPVGYPHNIGLWMLAFASALGLGVARGSFVIVQVDREQKLIRTRRAGDGLVAMRLLVTFACLELLATGTQPYDSPWRPFLAGGTAACAAFLSGRFGAVWCRAKAECHMELGAAARCAENASRIERSAPAWAGGTAGLTVTALAARAPDLFPLFPPPWNQPSAIIGADRADVAHAQPARSIARDARGRFMSVSKLERILPRSRSALAAAMPDER